MPGASRPRTPTTTGMEVVEVEGEDISPEDFHNDAGWLSCHKQRRQSTYSTLSSPARRPGTGCFGAATSSRLPARYRQPRLPKRGHHIVLRPRDGLDVRKHSDAQIRDAIYSATALQPSDVEMDIVRTKPTHNIVIISTPKIGNTEKYNALREIRTSDKTYEIRAYATAPEDTTKGVIYNIPDYDSDEDINKSLKYSKNPTILTARRMGKINSAIIIFEGSQVPYFGYYRGAEYRCFLHKKKQEICDACGGVGHRKDVCPQPENKTCKTCGASNPDSAHGCIPQCAICGKDHVTGDKRCRQRYKTPYLLIQRKGEKIKQQRLHYQHAGSEASGSDRSRGNAANENYGPPFTKISTRQIAQPGERPIKVLPKATATDTGGTEQQKELPLSIQECLRLNAGALKIPDSPPPNRKASEILNRPRIQEEIRRQLSVNLDKRFDSITEKIESKIADFAASIQKQMGIMNTRITKLENTLAVQCNDPRLPGNTHIVGEHN
ncbi:hypothetical protein HPB48_015504 [Haemaphysalis longicornis]|uniref:CCHC-type domain-containing protein n=1 Tax=Haemaphysalis longicornis TaxID=44386 RepID=A0A9J6F8Q0_HAELO|nr:hypothetical protein HPB48_015504 [Haemaphysalis longicornis]